MTTTETAPATREIVVPLTVGRYAAQKMATGQELGTDQGHWDTRMVITVPTRGGRRQRCGLMFVDATGSARLVHQGPMVPGPHVLPFALASVIDNFGGTAAEARTLRADGLEIDVEPGDVLVLGGTRHLFVADNDYGHFAPLA